ncbi:MAG: hypothetical protein CMG62_10890 [Candidatus Marinimicrobia bacterium]|nr:hypothetical protein [Candidatus Neomarinimicrobiota bacterium]
MGDKILIIIFSEGLLKEIGGPSISIPKFSSSLRRKGVNSIIFCPKKKLDINLLPQDVKAVPYSGYIDFIKELSRILNSNEFIFDIFHINFIWKFELLILFFTAFLYKVKIILNPRGMLTKEAISSGSVLKKPLLNYFMKPLLNRNITCFQASSKNECDELERIFPKKRIFINTLGFERFKENEVQNVSHSKKFSSKTLLVISRIDSHKNIQEVISSFIRSEIYRQGWSLKIFGAESLTDYEEIIDKENLENLSSFKIELYEFISRSEKVRLISNSSFFISASKSESYGLSIAESLDLGTPIIIRNNTLWEEYITRGCGYSFDSEGLDQIMLKLKTLDLSEYSSLVENIQSKFKPETWDNHTEIFLKELKTV